MSEVFDLEEAEKLMSEIERCLTNDVPVLARVSKETATQLQGAIERVFTLQGKITSLEQLRDDLRFRLDAADRAIDTVRAYYYEFQKPFPHHIAMAMREYDNT